MIGIFSKTTDSSFVEAAGLAGLDFIIIDQEHGPISQEKLYHHVRAGQISGLKTIVRVKNVDPHAISSALDSGADGVQVPNITTPDEAEQVVEAARFYPSGRRGVCRFVRAAEYGSKEKEKYFIHENTKKIILQVEGVEGIENIDRILDVEGFDVLFAGPYDLSQSLGLPGQIEHPLVMKNLKLLAQKTKEAGKIAGIFTDNPKLLSVLKNEGFEYIAYSVDVHLFLLACREVKKLSTS